MNMNDGLCCCWWGIINVVHSGVGFLLLLLPFLRRLLRLGAFVDSGTCVSCRATRKLTHNSSPVDMSKDGSNLLHRKNSGVFDHVLEMPSTDNLMQELIVNAYAILVLDKFVWIHDN